MRVYAATTDRQGVNDIQKAFREWWENRGSPTGHSLWSQGPIEDRYVVQMRTDRDMMANLAGYAAWTAPFDTGHGVWQPLAGDPPA